jgi:ankyrin repeat protein
MKHLLLTTIAAVLLTGCGDSLTGFLDTKLRSAVRVGSVDDVKKAIANGANVNAKSPSGSTHLHAAAQYGHMEIVQLLISKGANVKAKTDDGKTPLHSAAAKEHKDIAELLIAKGADVNAKSNEGTTPLHWATGTGWRGGYEIAKLLISKGADVNVKKEDGWTPLHNAAREGRKETIKILIANGADVHAKSNGGTTPLHAAANGRRRPRYRPGQPDHGISGEQIADLLIIVETLIAKGADVNAKTDKGTTPLDSAILGKNKETTDLLRKHGGKTGAELKAEGK